MNEIRLHKKYDFKKPNYVKIYVSHYSTELNTKISNNEFETENAPCLCGSLNFDRLFTFDRYGINQDSVICRRCGLIQSNPRMTENSCKIFYEEDYYRNLYTPNIDIEEYTKSKFSIDAGKQIFDTINSSFPISKSTKVLEIGAGGGWNLGVFNKLCEQVVGIEYSHRLVELGKTYGINMIQGGVEEIQDKYDIIILNHVLEHMLSPIKELCIIKKHLTPKGILYISVPNILNFSFVQIQSAHVNYFNPINFKYYVEQAALKTIDIGESESIHMYGIFSENDKKSENKKSTFFKDSRRASYRAIRRYKINKKMEDVLLIIVGNNNSEKIKKIIRKITKG